MRSLVDYTVLCKPVKWPLHEVTDVFFPGRIQLSIFVASVVCVLPLDGHSSIYVNVAYTCTELAVFLPYMPCGNGKPFSQNSSFVPLQAHFDGCVWLST